MGDSVPGLTILLHWFTLQTAFWKNWHVAFVCTSWTSYVLLGLQQHINRLVIKRKDSTFSLMKYSPSDQQEVDTPAKCSRKEGQRDLGEGFSSETEHFALGYIQDETAEVKCIF